MPRFENEAARPRAGERSTGYSSPATRGGGRTTFAAPGAATGRWAALRHSVWAGVAAKAAAVTSGMLLLAAIGASSLARGSGVPLAATAKQRPVLAGLGLQMPAAVSFAAAAPPQTAVPSALEQREPAPGGGTPADPAPPSAGLTVDGKVILNRADAAELRHLPGIGAKRADAIIALRAKLGGRFKRVSDLLRVKGIGPKGLKKIEPHVVLDEPKPS
jgi:competence protein ComEA